MDNKKRLIDADKLENYIRTNAKVEHDDTQYDIGRVHGLINAAGLIHFAPTVDAVEVVRCKDCLYNENGCCTRSELYDDTRYRPDYFCADGERKERHEP